MQEIIFSNLKIKENWKVVSHNLTKSKKYPQKKSTAAGAIAESKIQKDFCMSGQIKEFSGLLKTMEKHGKKIQIIYLMDT